MLDQAYYYPLKWGTVGVFHVRGGFLQGLSYGSSRRYELFYLGGIDTIRGFQYANISPRDPVTHDRIGGNKFFQVNTEFRFPVPKLKQYGIIGEIFFDCGNVYGSSAKALTPNVRTSAGAGHPVVLPHGAAPDRMGLKPGQEELRTTERLGVHHRRHLLTAARKIPAGSPEDPVNFCPFGLV